MDYGRPLSPVPMRLITKEAKDELSFGAPSLFGLFHPSCEIPRVTSTLSFDEVEFPMVASALDAHAQCTQVHVCATV